MTKHTLLQDTLALLHQITEQNPQKVAHPQQLMEHLSEIIAEHNHLYHITGAPIIADKQYDDLRAYLLLMEKTYPDLISPNSPSQKIGGVVRTSFQKQTHGDFIIRSLQNSYNANDIEQRATFVMKHSGAENITYLVEPKFDGSSVHLIWKHGHFHQAITRGDGTVGEDITANVQTIQNLPLFVPALADKAEVHCRGEIMMPKYAFNKLNEEQLAQGGSLFANERNATAGTLRQLDPEIVRKRRLIVYIHDILNPEVLTEKYTHDTELKAYMRSIGLPLYDRHMTATTAQEIVAICKDTQTKTYLDDANVLFDGLVIKIDQLAFREQLGYTEHHPRWAIAYKFPAQQVVTQLQAITYQVGRTGVITPVAELDPVSISGVTIARATLHNMDFIENSQIKLQDMVWVQRSGEVIPYIVGPVVEQRTGEEQDIAIPTTCPSCGTELVQRAGEVALLCPNHDACPAQMQQHLQHLVSKYAFDIDGMGEKLIALLMQQDIITHRPDIYRLLDDEYARALKMLPGVGTKTIEVLQKELHKKLELPLRRLLHGLSISFVGKKIATLLARYVAHRHAGDTLMPHDLPNYFGSLEDLLAIDGIGEQTAQALVLYFSTPQHIKRLDEAEDYGLVLLLPTTDSDQQASGPLADKKIVISGTFSVTRDVLKEYVHHYGATSTTSISKTTDYLLIGENPGASKVKKATQLEVPIISLSDLQKKYDLDPLKENLTHQPTNSPSLFSS